MSLLFPGAVTDVRPSFGQGFARCAAEAENPGLWHGLAGLWDPTLGATGAVVRDVSGQHRDGTWNGTGSHSGRSIYGPCWTLNGTDDFIGGIGADVFWDSVFAGNYSIVAWFWRAADVPMQIVAKWWDGSIRQFGLLYENAKLRWDHSNDAGDTTLSLDSTTTVNVQVWYHGAITKNQTTGEKILYLNSQAEASTTQTQSSTNNAPLRIGNEEFAGADQRFWNGKIGPIPIWKRVLAPSEIRSTYRDQHAVVRPRQIVFPEAGAVTAPTSHLYGSLVGPLGGPI